jgi:uncharacterized repeat protein (TIGR01451 family)/LPXTG-motif cell wall-anchored protein
LGGQRLLANGARRAAFVILAALLSTAQFFVPGLVSPASAAGLSTNFFDYSNHDVATTNAGLVDWANNGALTSTTTLGGTWTRAGDQGIFDGGKYNGPTKPPTPPVMTANANALKAAGTIDDAKFLSDPISSDTNWSCTNGNTTTTVSGDTTTFTGAGSEKNNGDINTFTYGTSGNTPGKDDLSNVYAVSHRASGANEIFFGGERIVNNGDSHIDFEFLQAPVTIPNPCAPGTFSGHRTQRDLLLSTDFTNGGTLGGAQLYSWSCNGIAPGQPGYDASKDNTICDPTGSNSPAQYVAIPSQNNGVTVASFGVNAGATAITCGGWVCRSSNGSSTTTLAQNALMEGGIDLASAGFKGCISTFLPHTRSAQTFTATLKDFAGPIAFSNCKQPTIDTQQSSSGVTSASSIQVGIGSSVTDTATLHGTASNVGGTVSYKLYSDSNCTTQVADGGTKTVSGTTGTGDLALPSSDAVPVNTAGTYYWQATYSGDIASGGANEPVTSNCGDEVLTVVAPSLSITKTADAATVNAGDPIGFTITVTNTGAGVANNVSVNDPLPTGTGVTWSIASQSGGCSITGTPTLSCSIPTLAANGGSASVHITSPTTFASCKLYHNTATAGASNVQGTVQASADTTVQCPNLTITKTADASPVSAGANIGFSISVHNAGPGVARGVTLSDPLPTGPGVTWSIDTNPGGCSIGGNPVTLSCTPRDLASGATMTVHITSATQFASCTTYPNTATAHASNFTPDPTSNASIVVQCPGLQITKTADHALVNAGDSIGFGITVTNTGPGTATQVTVTDPLPSGSGVNWSIDTNPGNCTITGSPATSQTLNCTFGDMGANISKFVHVTSSTANASCGGYPNTATASATNIPSPVQSQALTTVQCPNLSITKTADNASVNSGDQIGFTIVTHNAGPGLAKQVVVNDPLPTGTGISWSIASQSPANSCSIGGNPVALSCGPTDMASGATITVHIVSGTTGAQCKVYTNVASAQGSNAPKVTAQDSTNVLCPGLDITKHADAGTVDAGSNIGFTITVSNTGAGTATNVVMTDPLPAGTGVDWSIDNQSIPNACSIAGQPPSEILNCTLNNMGPQASASVHITSATAFASCKTYTNTATASATNEPTPVQATDSTTVQCPNLTLTKTADASSVSAGSQIGFTITVHNAGPGTATNVHIDDPLPTGTGISWSIASQSGGCSLSNNNTDLTCDFPTLASGATKTVHIVSGTTKDTPCQAYNNIASLTAGNHPPLTANASETVLCPGLQITKTADAASVDAGMPIGFTITVHNTGQGTANNVVMNDTLPTGVGVVWSIASQSGGCQLNGNALSCGPTNLAPGDSITVHVTSPTTFDSCKNYPNTASAVADNAGTVQASAAELVNCPALTLQKAADNGTVNAGEQIGFTLTLHNGGQGNANNVTITDPLPQGTDVSWSMSPVVPGCSIVNSLLSCNFNQVTSGQTITIHVISGTTMNSCKAYPNDASANAQNEPTPVTAHATTTVDCPVLGITKTADATPVSTGTPIGFTVTVSNSNAPGTGTAKNVTVVDPLPAGNGVDWSVDQQPASGTCSIVGPLNAQVLNCTLGNMAPGDSRSVHITSATTKDSAGTYPNTATASADNALPKQASATIVVIAPALSITKVADATPVSTGTPIGFTVTVSNSNAPGTGTAKNVSLNDPLPAGNGVDWSKDTGPADCSVTGPIGTQVLACPNLGDFGPGASVSIHIVSNTTKDSAGTYPNTATASSDNTDSVQATATIIVLAPSITIHKSAHDQSVSAGSQIGFDITVANGGPGMAKDVVIDDPLPAKPGVVWSINPAYAGPGTCGLVGNALHCTLGDLGAETQVTVHVTGTTTAASCGEVDNTATVSASNADSQQSSATTLVNCPTLTLTKTADKPVVSAGDDIGFTMTVSNAGPGTATGVTLNDPLPTGATNSGISWFVDPAKQGCSIVSDTLSCGPTTLLPGDNITVHVTSHTTAAACGPYDNTATASSTNGQPILPAEAITTVECSDLSITKVADATPVNTGDPIGFTITVSNADNENTGTAKNVVMSDPLPAGDGVDWSIDTPPATGTCSISGAVGSQELHCSLGDMGPGDSASVHITSATTAASGGTYPNTATASADNNGPVHDTATIVVQPPALTITKTADAKQVTAGDKIGFTVTVANSDADGTGLAKSVTLADPLPGHDGVDWSIDPAYAGPGTCSITGTAPKQSLDCAFGDMKPGDSASIHISSKTTDASVASYPNTAVASATNGKSVHATAEIVVVAVTPVTALATTVPPTTVAQAVTLPRTGSNSGPMIWLGLVLLASGFGLATAGRRRIRTANR